MVWKCIKWYDVLSTFMALTSFFKKLLSNNMTLSSSEVRAHQQQLLKYVNRVRTELKLHPVRLNEILSDCAHRHTLDQIYSLQECSHTGSDGSLVFDRLEIIGYEYELASENVASIYTGVQEVMKAFMDSPDHRLNILHPDVTEMGLYVEERPCSCKFWTQIFAKPKWETCMRQGCQETERR